MKIYLRCDRRHNGPRPSLGISLDLMESQRVAIGQTRTWQPPAGGHPSVWTVSPDERPCPGCTRWSLIRSVAQTPLRPSRYGPHRYLPGASGSSPGCIAADLWAHPSHPAATAPHEGVLPSGMRPADASRGGLRIRHTDKLHFMLKSNRRGSDATQR
jgi:hypothetical protein